MQMSQEISHQLSYPSARMRVVGLIRLLAIFAMLLSGLPSAAAQESVAAASKIQPILQRLATQQPDLAVNIIVQKLGAAGQVEQQVVAVGGKITKDLHIINAFAANVPAKAIYTLAQAPNVRWISFDAPVAHANAEGVDDQPHTVFLPLVSADTNIVAATADEAENQGEIQAAAGAICGRFINCYLNTLQVWRARLMGYQGRGIGVAVIDSGISPDADFMHGNVSRVKANLVFRSGVFQPDLLAQDYYGHGTHVAGIIGGNGHDSVGFYQGIAPKVNLFNLNVNDPTGQACESDMVAALQWVLDNKAVHNIRVVNLSLNSTIEQPYDISPLNAAVEILWFNQVVVVVSAGNRGAGVTYNTANAAPANDPFVITVGASEERAAATIADDRVTSYSAYATSGNGVVKPDIVAPGANIISVLSSDSLWWQTYPERVLLNRQYFRLSGTSMAAPMVTGAVALLLEKEPNLTPDQVKYRLLNASNRIQGTQGDTRNYPYLNVYKALTTPTTQSANTGLVPSQWLWTGSEPPTWGSVNWNSVNWNSVNWNSVNWNSVNWNSVNWNSVSWTD